MFGLWGFWGGFELRKFARIHELNHIDFGILKLKLFYILLFTLFQYLQELIRVKFEII